MTNPTDLKTPPANNPLTPPPAAAPDDAPPGKLRVSFKEALARDKTRTQVFEISELGLVEMTRKRVSEGLIESFSAECPTCNGRGIVLDESLL